MTDEPTQMDRIEEVLVAIHDLLVDVVEELRDTNANTYAAKGSLDQLVDHSWVASRQANRFVRRWTKR